MLSGLVKRIADGASGVSIGTPDDVAAFKAGARLMTHGRHAPEEERPMFDLTGKTALVTGATGGIGGAIARALHGQGATVALSGTRREVLDALAGELGERAHVLPCNLADMAEVEALVPQGRGGDGQARHPGGERRHHARQSVRPVEGRGLGRGAGGQPDGDLPAGARRGAHA